MRNGSDATAQRRDPVPAKVSTLLAMAAAAKSSGDYLSGAQHARAAADLAHAQHDPASEAVALRLLAEQQICLGDHEAAVNEAEASLLICGELGDDAGTSRTLNVKAFALMELGLHEEALTAMAASLELATKLKDNELLYWVYNRTGTIHASFGNYRQADTFLLHAKAFSKNLDAQEQFCILNNLSDNAVGLVSLLRERKDEDGAQKALLPGLQNAWDALALAQEARHPYRQAISLANLGRLLTLNGEFDRALGCLNDAKDIALKHGYRSLELDAILGVALVQEALGNFDAAIAELSTILGAAADVGEKPVILRTLMALSKAYQGTGNFRAALDHFKQYHELEAEIKSTIADTRARLLASHLDLEKARLEIEQHRQRSSELEVEKLALQRRASDLDRQAHQDKLTGLWNRRHVEAQFPAMLADAAAGTPVSVALADIDFFKRVNDTHGHPLGDRVLQQVATILRKNSRPTDLVARWGGEEFMLVFTGATLATAREACERMRLAVARHNWSQLAIGLGVTLSFGLSHLGDGVTPEALIAAADARLYTAKLNGRDRVEPQILGQRND